MRLELERGLEPNVSKKLKQTIIDRLCVFSELPLLLLTLKELFDVALQFAHPMTQKWLNLVKEGMSKKYWEFV